MGGEGRDGTGRVGLGVGEEGERGREGGREEGERMERRGSNAPRPLRPHEVYLKSACPKKKRKNFLTFS